MTVKIDELGRMAILSSPLSPKDLDAIRRSGVRRLQLKLRDHDMAFLRDLEGIEEVQIIDLTLKSDGAVAALPNLRVLGLETYSDDPIDFASFKRLERLAFNWRPRGDTAFAVASLKSLRISRYPGLDLTPLAQLPKLEGLRIDSSRRLRSLEGVAALGALRVLSLRDDQGLVDVSDLAAMDQSLDELELNRCHKVTSLAPIERHHELRRLSVIDCGHLPSLTPLAHLGHLEEFYFYGTTYIDDGDMTPMLGMTSLRKIAFAPRRHYSHREEDIERLRLLKETPWLPHWLW